MKDYDSLKERHLIGALSKIVDEYILGPQVAKEDHTNTSSYNPNWYYSVKYHKGTGLIVGVHGTEFDGLDYFPSEDEANKYETVYLGKLTQEEFGIFAGYEMNIQDTFVRFDKELQLFSVFKIQVTCSGEYIEPMDAYYSATGEFDVEVKISNLTEQMKETLLEGFYVKDMSKGEIAITGMAMETNGYKTQVTKTNPKFKAIVKNTDNDDSNQVLRIRAKFLGGDDIDLNPNTVTKYLMLLTQMPSEEELEIWKRKMIRRSL